MVELRGQTSEALAVVCAEREWACMYPVWRGMRVRCNVCLVLLGLFFSCARRQRGRPARPPIMPHITNHTCHTSVCMRRPQPHMHTVSRMRDTVSGRYILHM